MTGRKKRFSISNGTATWTATAMATDTYVALPSLLHAAVSGVRRDSSPRERYAIFIAARNGTHTADDYGMKGRKGSIALLDAQTDSLQKKKNDEAW